MIRYSINDLEKLTGIKAHTIRMWEKRYNIISPERTQTNIRYYDNDDLKKLLNISTLNKQGHKISKIALMDEDTIREKVMDINGSNGDHEVMISNLIIAMISFREDFFEHILNSAILKLDFEQTVIRVLYPFLEKIGVLWQVGSINPAQEHFIVNLIRQKMIIAIDGQSKPPSEESKSFLLFLPEQEFHELGLLFYNYLIKKNGYKVVYLGQSVPFSDVEEVVRVRKVDYLFTYFVAALNKQELPEYIQKLSAAFPGKKIFVTGLQIRDEEIVLPKNIFFVKNTEAFKNILKEA